MLNTIKLNRRYKTILCISDTHFPVHHPDTFLFLKYLKKKYKPDLVVQIGDIIDLHNFSRYEYDPNFISPINEIKKSIDCIKHLESIFPKIYVTLGNHDTRIIDKGMKVGIPDYCFKPFKEIFKTKRFHYCFDLKLNWKDEKRRILFTHGKFIDPIKTSVLEASNIIQGHYHTRFEIKYVANSSSLHWGMNIGCLVNQKHMVFNYSKKIPKKFILGCGIIKDNKPILEPMILNDKGNWIGNG